MLSSYMFIIVHKVKGHSSFSLEEIIYHFHAFKTLHFTCFVHVFIELGQVFSYSWQKKFEIF